MVFMVFLKVVISGSISTSWMVTFLVRSPRATIARNISRPPLGPGPSLARRICAANTTTYQP